MKKTGLVPRVAAIHDLSSVGRCSLSAILPILSSMGCQVIPCPTAYLSSQTWGAKSLHFRDLTEDMQPVADRFCDIGINFSAIYSGFLGSERQIGLVLSFLDRFAKDTKEKPLILVDPVMGEDGELYSTYTKELAEGMKKLVARADIITPNLTEACFLTDTAWFDAASVPEKDLRVRVGEIAERLHTAYGAQVVITGVATRDAILNVGIDRNGVPFSVAFRKVGATYPGTGDIFATVLLGRLLSGDKFPRAVAFAADFVGYLLKKAVAAGAPPFEGLPFERELSKLLRRRCL